MYDGHPKLKNLEHEDTKLKKQKKIDLIMSTYKSLSNKCTKVKNEIYDSYDNMITEYFLENLLKAINDLNIHISSNADKAMLEILKTNEYHQVTSFYESIPEFHKGDLVPVSARRDERPLRKSVESNLSFMRESMRMIKMSLKPTTVFQDFKGLYDMLNTKISIQEKEEINLKIKILKERKLNHGK